LGRYTYWQQFNRCCSIKYNTYRTWLCST